MSLRALTLHLIRVETLREDGRQNVSTTSAAHTTVPPSRRRLERAVRRHSLPYRDEKPHPPHPENPKKPSGDVAAFELLLVISVLTEPNVVDKILRHLQEADSDRAPPEPRPEPPVSSDPVPDR